jgi:chromosome segregation ATPase
VDQEEAVTELEAEVTALKEERELATQALAKLEEDKASAVQHAEQQKAEVEQQLATLKRRHARQAQALAENIEENASVTQKLAEEQIATRHQIDHQQKEFVQQLAVFETNKGSVVQRLEQLKNEAVETLVEQQKEAAEQLERSQEAATQQAASLEADKATLAQELATQKEEISAVTQQLMQQKEEHSTLQEFLAEAKEELKDAKEETEAEQEKHDAEKEKLDDQVSSLESTVASLKIEKETLDTKVSCLAKKKESLDAKVSSLETTVSSLEKNFESSSQQYDKLYKANETLSAEHAALQEFLSDAKQELEDVREEAEDEASAMRSQLAGSEGRLEATASEYAKLNALQTQFEELQTRAEKEKWSFQDQLTELDTQLGEAYQQGADVEAKLKSEEAYAVMLKTQLAELTELHQQLEARHTTIADEHSELTQQAAGVGATFADLETQHRALMEEHATLRSDFTAQEETLQTTQREVETAVDKLSTQVQDTAHAQEVAAMATKSEKELLQSQDALTTELRQSRSSGVDLMQLLQENTFEYDLLKARFDSLKTKKINLEMAMARIKEEQELSNVSASETSAYQEALGQLRADLTLRSLENEALSCDKARLKGEVTALHQQMETLEMTLAELETGMQHVDKAQDTTQQLLADAHSELSSSKEALADLLAEVQIKDEALTSAQGSVTELAGQVTSLEKALEDKTESLQLKILTLEETAAKMRQSTQNKSEVHGTEHAIVTSLTTDQDYQDLVLQHARLQAETDDLSARLGASVAQERKSIADLDELKVLTAELRAAHAESMSEGEAYAMEQVATVERLTTECASLQTLDTEKSGLATQLGAVDQHVAELEAELATQSVLAARLPELMVTVEELTSQLTAKQLTLTDTAAALANVTEQFETSEKALAPIKKSVNELESRLSGAKEEVTAAKEQLAEVKRTAQATVKENEKLSKYKEKNAKESEKADGKLKAIEAKFKDANADKLVLQSDKVTLERELKQTKKLVETQAKDLDRHSGADTQRRDISTSFDALEKKHDKLNKEAEKFNIKFDTATSQLDTAKDRVKQLESEKAEALAALDIVRTHLAGFAKASSKFEEPLDLATARSQVENWQGIADVSSGEADDIKAQLDLAVAARWGEVLVRLELTTTVTDAESMSNKLEVAQATLEGQRLAAEVATATLSKTEDRLNQQLFDASFQLEEAEAKRAGLETEAVGLKMQQTEAISELASAKERLETGLAANAKLQRDNKSSENLIVELREQVDMLAKDSLQSETASEHSKEVTEVERSALQADFEAKFATLEREWGEKLTRIQNTMDASLKQKTSENDALTGNVAKALSDVEKFKGRANKFSSSLTAAKNESKVSKVAADRERTEGELLRDDLRQIKTRLSGVERQLELKQAAVEELEKDLTEKEEECEKYKKQIPNEKKIMQLIHASRKMSSHANKKPTSAVEESLAKTPSGGERSVSFAKTPASASQDKENAHV